MKPRIINNFVDQNSFQLLKNDMFGSEFCWNYNEAFDYENEEGDRFQFTHNFYSNIGPCSAYYGRLNGILGALRPKEIFRIKANLLTKTSEIVKNSFHIDIDALDILPWKTGILYMNTNDGYTEFEDGTVVESVANRFVIFPANMKHRGTSCTNEKIRVAINFNYLT